MKDHIQTWLEETGLDPQRATLYRSALSLGETTAKDLASATGLQRTAVYDNLRVLEQRGYVTSVRHGRRMVFIPLHPKELYRKFARQKQQLRDLLPDFLALYANKTRQPFVQLFEGPLGARAIFEDILLNANDDYVYLWPPQLTLATVDRSFLEDWVRRRVAKGIHARALHVKAHEVVNDPLFTDEAKYLRQVRYLPGHIELRAAIYVYGQNIGVIATKKESTSFIIHSADLAFDVRQVFDFLWGISLRS